MSRSSGSRFVALGAAVAFTAAAACGPSGADGSASETPDEPAAPPPFEIAAGEPFAAVPEEVHLRNVRQLTFEGENAEAYFSFDGTSLVFQRTGPDGGCDQIYTMDLASGATERVSTGEGRTTCAYYYPDGDRILYSSTHLDDARCPARPDYSRGYVWPVYGAYDVFVTDGSGGAPVRLTDSPGYDAEATISPVGDRVVFTSVRDGDLDLYTMALDGTDVRRVTDRVGYDGGAFFSPDGTRLVWRAHYPETEEAVADYRALLDEGLIRPTTLEIYVAAADGSGQRAITDNGAANFAPYWHPSGDKILFSSNMGDPTGRDFDIYMVNADGSGLQRVTFTGDFDGFPVFSPDGRWLVWGSNRNASHPENTNIFIAEWVDAPEAVPAAGNPASGSDEPGA